MFDRRDLARLNGWIPVSLQFESGGRMLSNVPGAVLRAVLGGDE